MNSRLKVLRLFGHWEEAKIQGTNRTYNFYAYHLLDRLLSVGLFLVAWGILFIFVFCRSPKPGNIGIWVHGIRLLYLPADIKPLIRLFSFWMVVPGIWLSMLHIREHGKQQRILWGELTARQGVLTKVGYFQYQGRGGVNREYRFLLEIPKAHGKTVCEVYKMPGQLFKAFEDRQKLHVCRVELVLLPPKKLQEQKPITDFSGAYVNQLQMCVVHIFYLESLPTRCQMAENLLFIA